METCELTKKQKIINIKKAISSLNKILKMVEDDKYCVDIMQQNLAVIGLIKSLHSMLMESHLKSCFSSAMKSSDNKKKDQMIEEILRVTKLMK